ncbi:MAG: tRNA (adenosine(37)-N6)-dimethylallyltransferase MiaA [Gemmatimonadales bacterium]
MEATLAVLGPTATGKTALALELGERLDAEIVSLDSRQAYRGLVIGTAAPTPEELQRVPHHGVGTLAPGTRYGAGRFARQARDWISEIRRRGRLPLLVGGTGLFYRALTRPIFREPPMDPDRRAALEAWLEERPLGTLRRWTATLDPALRERLDVLDRQRCLRAIEMALMTGRPISWWQRHGPPEAEPVESLPIVLTLPGEEHRRRIRERAARALSSGWADEVRALRAAGHDRDSPAFSSIGYEAVAAWMAGEVSREEALSRIVRDTWSYARRQRTWFRHQLPDHALRLDGRRPVDELADRVVEARAAWNTNGGGEGTSA